MKPRDIAALFALAVGTVAVAACTANTYHAPTRYRVMISPSFTTEQQAVIVDAVDKWVAAVGDPNRLAVDVSIGPCAPNPDDPLSAIFISPSQGPLPLHCGGHPEGCTNVMPDNYTSSVIDVTYGDLGTLSHIAQHELGHAFGLHHTGQGTLMFPTGIPYADQGIVPGGAAQNVTPADVQQYISVH